MAGDDPRRACKTFRPGSPLVHVRLAVEGSVEQLDTPLIFVGNNRYRLDLLNVGARDRLDERVLSLYVARPIAVGHAETARERRRWPTTAQDRDFEMLYPREFGSKRAAVA